MKTTMIIYESHHGSAKKAATMLGTIIGNTKLFPVDKAPDTINFNKLSCFWHRQCLGSFNDASFQYKFRLGTRTQHLD